MICEKRKPFFRTCTGLELIKNCYSETPLCENGTQWSPIMYTPSLPKISPAYVQQQDSRDNANDATLTHLLYPLCNSYYQTLSTHSVSVGDVRITRCSPTPTQSSASSTSVATSIGDISTCSAPTPPCGSLVSSACVSPCVSTATSPETRRRQWRRLVHRVRHDLEGVCHLIKKSSINDPVPHDPDTPSVARKRTLVVEFEEDRLARDLRHAKHSRWPRFRRHHVSTPDDLDNVASLGHVVKPTLVLRSLANCKFHAEVYLPGLTPGNLILRIFDNRIYILINKNITGSLCSHNNCTSSTCENGVELYGKIDLPIYVKPRSLNFLFRDEINVLRVLCETKSFGISLSNTDLCLSEGEMSPKAKQRGNLETIFSIDPSFGSMDSIPASMFETIVPSDNNKLSPTTPKRELNRKDEGSKSVKHKSSSTEAKRPFFRRRSFTK